MRAQILQGVLKPGDKVVQSNIAENLGVSRIPVREAINTLISEGLLELQPHRGTIVTPISPHLARQVFGLRSLIEPELLKLAGPNINAEIIADARACLDTMKRTKDNLRDFQDWADNHWAFHMLLYKPSEQEFSLEIVRKLMQHSERFIALENADSDKSKFDHNEHEEMLSLCEAKQFDEASLILAQHILRTPQVVESIT